MSWFASHPPARWVDAVLEDPDPLARADELHRAFVYQELDAWSPVRNLSRWDRWLGRKLLRLADALPGKLQVVERHAETEREVRRWCWAPSWVLSSQDEDLVLTHDLAAPWLLSEARYRCPKERYATSIVAHWARDSLHYALWTQGGEGPGGPEVRARIAERLAIAADWSRLARRTCDLDTAAYLQRISSYGATKEVLNVAEVVQRALDVRRCAPGPDAAPRVRRRDGWWKAPLKRGGSGAGTLFVCADSGAMWAATRKELGPGHIPPTR